MCAALRTRSGGASSALTIAAHTIPDARMRPMLPKLGSFRAALLTGWIVLRTAGWLYVRGKNISLWAALPIIAVFFFVYSFYLVPSIELPGLRVPSRPAYGC